MRLLLPRVFLSAAVLALAAAADSAPTPAAAPSPIAPIRRHAAERREALARVERDVAAVFAECKVAAAQAMVNAFRKYTPDQLNSPSTRDVTVEKLLLVVGDETVREEIRESAANYGILWEKALQHDPQLDPSGKGARRPRAGFSRKVLPLLVDKEEFTRSLAKKILDTLWPNAGAREPDILNCIPRSRQSCVQARIAWEKYLSRG